ncbi:MAG: glycosyltransferase family 2 protein [Clostridia bacterium]|nr:glycosyltransferase family 2 protein [Clostridia bacterium]
MLNLATIIIGIMALPFLVWAAVLFVSGMLPRKAEKAAVTKALRFAVLVCARNEENVIGNLIDSLAFQTYPKSCYEIFVVAHNCTDNTAAIAQEYGATVIEAQNPSERCKGDAMRHGIDYITKKHQADFDALCVFDADNLVNAHFLSEMNKALQGDADGALGMRDSHNAHKSAISEAFALYWLVNARVNHASRSLLHLPCFLQGTGFAIKLDILPKEGWRTFTLTEDIEFSIQQMLLSHHFTFVKDAVFYDEQPCDTKTWFHQIFRWMFGTKQCISYLPKILDNVRGKALQVWDMLWYILSFAVGGITFGAQVLLLISSTFSAKEFFTVARGCVVQLALMLVVTWLLSAICASRCGKDASAYAKGILIYPFLMASMFALFLASVFLRTCDWKPIAHGVEKSKKKRRKHTFSEEFRW